jgi:hypothetical protein
MLWECSECGALIERVRPPTVCNCCGLAGVTFTPASPGLEYDPEAESFREAWFYAGFELAERPQPGLAT